MIMSNLLPSMSPSTSSLVERASLSSFDHFNVSLDRGVCADYIHKVVLV